MIASAAARDRRETTGIEGILDAFSSKNAEGLAVSDALLQMALDGKKPVGFKEAARFLEHAEIGDLFGDEFTTSEGVEAAVRSTPGLLVEKRAFGIDRTEMSAVLAVAAKRLRVLTAVQNVLRNSEETPPRLQKEIAGRVEELLAQSDARDEAYPRGRIGTVEMGALACSLALLHRVLGSSPQLEAFLALCVAGGEAPLGTIEGALRAMKVKKLPSYARSLFSKAAERSVVELNGQRAVLDEGMSETVGQGIAGTRRLIASLHRHLPKEEKIRPHHRHAPAVPSTAVVPPSGHPAETTPEPPTPVPDEREDIASILPQLAGHDDVMADWHARRRENRLRREGKNGRKNGHSGPLPASAHQRIKQSYGDERRALKEPTVIATTDARQESRFDPVVDNPVMYRLMIEHYGNEADARAAVERACGEGRRRPPKEKEEIDPRSSWPVLVTPPKPVSGDTEVRRAAPVRAERFVVDEHDLDLGKDELAKMQFVLSRCIASSSGMAKADFVATFGRHLYEGAACGVDVNAALDDLIVDDAERLAAARTIATYGLHSVTEYVALRASGGEGSVDWHSLPVNRRHELHAAYVAALALEIERCVRQETDFSPNTLRYLTGAAFLGEHFSKEANMSFGAHVQSLIEAAKEGDSVEDPGRSRDMSLAGFIVRYGTDDGFGPWNKSGWQPTDAPAGSPEKIGILEKRAHLGQHLWHPEDRTDYTGLTGAIAPRED